MFNKVFILLTVAASTVLSAPSPTRRSDDDTATCTYTFIPSGPIDPNTNLVAEFNYITGYALAVADTGHFINNSPSTFVEKPNGTFKVHNQLSAEGWTCEQTKEFMESLAGTDREGPSLMTWTIQAVACTCHT